MDLKGTVAVVTGGNGGLGQRICHALAAQGCHIAVVYAKSKDQAEGVAKDLQKYQVTAATFACDVTKRDDVQKLVDDVVKRFGAPFIGWRSGSSFAPIPSATAHGS